MNKQAESQIVDDLIEIINLEAIKQLPKSTEHFISDLHGEFEAFDHLLRNCSGVISIKVADLFDDILTKEEQLDLCFNIYYPEDILLTADKTKDEWITLLDQLVQVTRHVSSKYTRSKVRKALPKPYDYILEELIYQYDEESNKLKYYHTIFNTIIDLNLANHFAVALALLIQRFVVDHLHVLGDIYDRGPNPDKIVDRLMEIPSLDIQLGNHDIIWIGAYSGSMACLTNVLRIQLRYGHTHLLEDYEIDLSRLAKYGRRYYQDNKAFHPRGDTSHLTQEEIDDITLMHQAISIMQFKVESQLILRRPEFKMEKRLLLDKLSKDQTSITLEGESYPIENGCFQRVDPDNPYELTLGEELILLDLLNQFQNSLKLERHINFLVLHGTMYKAYNGNLLFHGCLPCTEEGEFMEIELEDERLKGKSLMDRFEKAIMASFRNKRSKEDFDTDLIWYLWCGEVSTLFGKHSMKTFERYFLTDKKTHKEIQNPYYRLRDSEEFCNKILEEFELEKSGYIINGHTPVKALEGEKPVKANGKMLVIDGGLAKPYQKVTGIAGYTLVDNSHEIYICAHSPFTTKEDAIASKRDILPKQFIVTERARRQQVADTDIGKMLDQQSQKLRDNLPPYHPELLL
ncbi:fructose-1,6-bisphosphatase [Facklamia sp. DSM 111018]|uniref:Fructose-1,6-bisphosphatase class 3 n=1 Tax=Facklamia lactis TaxID=2749967 RepID=A0ABS0LP53_9LACT|nr:fructose-1,6-bisphosphatase [Facklamia lactis]MBG9980045.1 fructose-1,6-bisphosphatase [Facklamia lactis]MBG9985275.1 fructose-1,6-bisphosphatase [Facklamia lactis]